MTHDTLREALASGMGAEEQEALSRNCSDACFILLRLTSGRSALFDNRRRLLAIDDLPYLIARRELQTYIAPRLPSVSLRRGAAELTTILNDMELDL